MEELVEGAARGIWAAGRFVLWHVLFEVVLFNLGRVCLLTATLGRFPKRRDAERNPNPISAVGVAVVFAVWVGLAIYNQLTSGVAWLAGSRAEPSSGKSNLSPFPD